MSAFFFSLSTTAQQSIAPNSREETSGCEPGQIPSAVRVDAEGRPELFCQLPACALFPEDSAAAESSLPPPMPTTTAVNSPSSATSSSSSSTSMMMHSSPMVEQQTWGSTRQQSSEMASTRSTQHQHRQHRPQQDEEREGENGEEGEEAVDEQAIRRRIRRSTMQPSRTTLAMGTGVTRAAAAEDDQQQLQQQTMTTKMPAVRCGDTFTDVVCDLPNEWTGALSEVNNGTHISLFMQCCTVVNLAQWAAPLKRVVIGTDEQYGGGPVLHNGEMVAFDLIKEIRKNVTTDNQVLYVLSIHRALCLAPVPAIPPPPSAASASRNRLSKFSRLYPGARVGSNGGGGQAASAQSQQQQSAMDAARQHLPYSLIRKAVQKQREQRLMAINSRRRHPPRKSQEVGRENSLAGASTTDMAVLKPVATATLDGGVDVPGGSGEEQGFGSLKAASAADGRQSRPRVSPPPSSSLLGRSAGGGGGGGGDGQPQQRQRAIYGRRRPFRPFMYTQVPPLTQGGVVDDYDEEGEAAGGNGIPLWLLHRRRTPWSRLRRIGTDGSRQRTERPAGVEEGARLSQAAGNSGGSGNGAGGRFLTTSIQRRNGQQQHQQQQPPHNRLRGQRPQGKGVVIETSRTELLGPGRQQPAAPPLEKQKRKPEMAVHGHGGGATAGGTTKPRLYSDGAGQYAPDSQLPIRANSDDEFQSVVEQEILPDTLGPETAAAAAEEQQPSTAGLEPESSFEPVSETATPTAGENNFVTLIPQQNSYQQAQQQPQPLPVAVSAPVAAYQPQSLFPTGNSFGFGPFLPPTGQQLQQQHLPVVSAAGGCRGGAGCAGGANANNYNGNANANNNNYYNGFATSYPNGNGNGFTTSYGAGAGGCQNGRGGCGGSQSHVAPQPKCSSCACPACQHCRRSPRSTGSCSAEGGCGGGGGGGGECSAGCSCPEECACQAEAQANAAEWQAYQSQYGNGQAAQGQAPASSGTATGLNGAFAAMQCFSGDQQLRTARGRVRMDELRVGDLVLSVDESLVSYSPVVMFLHRRPQERAHFRLVQTEGGHQLKLTDFHLVWAGCTRLRLLRAMDLRPGQCLFVLADQEEEAAEGNNRTMLLPDSSSIPSRGIGLRTRLISRRITKIEQIQEEGIYAPLTANGNLIVNGVLASCHSNMAAQTLQQTFFRWLRSLHWLLSKWPFPWPTPSMEETPAGSEGDGAGGTAMVDGELPLGVRLVTQVLDTLLPKALLGGG